LRRFDVRFGGRFGFAFRTSSGFKVDGSSIASGYVTKLRETREQISLESVGFAQAVGAVRLPLLVGLLGDRASRHGIPKQLFCPVPRWFFLVSLTAMNCFVHE